VAPSLDDVARDRLRVAALACAGPRLRLALDTAAGAAECGDDDALLAALDAVDAAPREAARRAGRG
jgi:hypothetical protein